MGDMYGVVAVHCGLGLLEMDSRNGRFYAIGIIFESFKYEATAVLSFLQKYLTSD